MRSDGTASEVRQHLAAAPARVFAAFADASLVSQWLTPSPDVSLTVLHFDFRVGGSYRFAYRVPGAGTMFVNGVYRTIAPPERLEFSWNIEPPDEHAGIQSLVIVTMAARDTGTDLVIRHQKLDRPGAAVRHAVGWRGALDRLTALLDAADWRSADAPLSKETPR